MITVEVTVCEMKQYDIPESLQSFVSFLNEKISEIPLEYRSVAKVEIASAEYSACLNITYCRPETEEEVRNRQHMESQSAARAERLERARLAELLEKYGTPT